MARFASSFWGALLGTLVAFFLGIVLLFFGSLMLVGIFSGGFSGEKTIQKKKGSLLHLKLKGDIRDKPVRDPFSKIILKYSGSNTLSLRELTHTIRESAKDEDISGVFLDEPSLESGLATLEELRAALLDFKASGKPVIAYASGMGQRDYYLASLADEIYLNPLGMLNHVGLAGQFISFKNLLDKLSIRAQLIRPDSNAFKSAAEPFLREKMSAENRQQLRRLLDVFWERMVADIASGRKTSPNRIREWASVFSGQAAPMAHKAGMVDGLKYYDELLALLKERTGTDEETPPMISAEDYYAQMNAHKEGKDKIVILYAEGSIVDESSSNEEDEIVGRDYAELLRKARQDKNVKGVILRVNSPGGSALASEIIHREVLLTKAVKPVYVSMGNYAASGGYYISCGADSLFADACTITGSIGVFGLLPDLSDFFRKNLGIQRDTVQTSEFADIMTPGKALSDKEYQVFKNLVNEVYDTFLIRVARGRRLEKARVHEVAQGRVWSGTDAQHIGLVDRITSLEGAVAAMKNRLDVTGITLEEWPKEKSFWEGFLKEGIFFGMVGQLFEKKISLPFEAPKVADYERFKKPSVWAVAPKLNLN